MDTHLHLVMRLMELITSSLMVFPVPTDLTLLHLPPFLPMECLVPIPQSLLNLLTVFPLPMPQSPQLLLPTPHLPMLHLLMLHLLMLLKLMHLLFHPLMHLHLLQAQATSLLPVNQSATTEDITTQYLLTH